MTIKHLKLKLEKSLKVFLLSVTFMSIMSFLSIYYSFDKWILGFAPSIIFFCLLGSFIVTKAIVYLSSIESEINDTDTSSLNDKFLGINGVQGLFYILIVLVYGTVFLITSFINYNILDFKSINLFITSLLLVLSMITIYYTLDHLTFVLFFISIIYGWTKGKKAKMIHAEIKDKHVSDDYDVDKNLKKLISRYSERISWLENHINEENKSEYESKIMIYQIVLNDLSDFIHGIEI